MNKAMGYVLVGLQLVALVMVGWVGTHREVPTVGGQAVPVVHCVEDEVLTMGGCVHIEVIAEQVHS